MSCEKQQGKVSATAAVKAGIGGLQSRFSAATGRMMGVLTDKVGRSATGVLAIVESFDGPKSLDALGAVPLALEVGTLLGSLRAKPQPDVPLWAARWLNQRDSRGGETNDNRDNLAVKMKRREGDDRQADRLRKGALLTLGLLKLGQAASIFAGTGLGRLSRQEKVGLTEGIERRFFFLNTAKLPVGVWKSKLTPLLNQADSGPGRSVRSSGIMFEIGGKTWHRGTVVVKTAQGERTLTHLQSLSLPATHYYYERTLSDNEAVGIAAGQKGFEPKHLPGYAGQVSEVEALFPAWAGLKHQLIKAHLRWGKLSGRAEAQGSRGAGEREEIHPLDGVKAQVRLGDQDYPVMVRRVVTEPGQPSLADAAYYDDQARAWKEVTDPSVRAHLARQVEAGLLETINGPDEDT